MSKTRKKPRPSFDDFPDEALQHPTGSTLASQPECWWCDGLIWAGETLVVLDATKLAHLVCFEMNASPKLVREVQGRIGKRKS